MLRPSVESRFVPEPFRNRSRPGRAGLAPKLYGVTQVSGQVMVVMELLVHFHP